MGITVEDVNEAYEKIKPAGWGPVLGVFFLRAQRLCCPMSALCLVNNNVPVTADLTGVHVLDWARPKYGAEYAEGFVHGVDDDDVNRAWRRSSTTAEYFAKYSDGYEDGLKVRDQVLAWQKENRSE